MLACESEALPVADRFTLTRRTVLFAPLVLAACKNGASVLEFSSVTMGTTYSVVAVDHTRSLRREEVSNAIEAALSEVNAQMSNWDAGSEISRFNNALTTETVPVSREIADLMSVAQDIHTATEGQFDVTLGPLIEMWGFGAAGAAGTKPGEAAIADALRSSGQSEKIRVESGALRKTDSQTRVYLSGIGKGHGVDRVANALAGLGLKDYLVEIGGDLYTAGRNPDWRPWQIGVESPDLKTGAMQQVAEVSNLGMATSGDYRNYFEEDGVRYSHILDAETGRPVTHSTASATVLADNAMLADAWATAMLGLGRERGMEVAEAQNVAVLFVDRDRSSSDLSFSATSSTRFAELQG